MSTNQKAIAAIDGAISFLSSGPDKWCQGAFARTSQGCSVGDVTAPDVVSCCMVGALYRAAGSKPNALRNPPAIMLVTDTVCEILRDSYDHYEGHSRPSDFNDHFAKNAYDVIKMLTEARERIVACEHTLGFRT